MTRLLFCLIVVLTVTRADAQAIDESEVINLIPGLDIEARIGLGLLTSSQEPTAVTAFLRNNTNQTIEGRLEITDRWRGKRLDLGEMYLAPAQARRFCSIRNFENWGNPVLSFVSDGQVVWQQPLMWSGYNNVDEQGMHRVGILHDGARDLQFQNELPVTSKVQVVRNNRYGWKDTWNVEFTDAGYQVNTASIKTWQMPDHFGPLEPLQAIIALESVDPEQLNVAQKTAIAKWIAAGGTFYLPVQSKELLEEIERVLPLAASPAILQNTLAIRRCGLGQIILYPEALFADSTAAAEDTIYRSIAALRKDAVRPAFGVELLDGGRNYGRNATRVSLMSYFFGYLVLSVVPIVFVTTKLKRKVLPYTLGLVGIGCLAAAVLGACLRTSTGEARWLTVTVPGENGAVQFADIELRSTGGIGGTAAVSGIQPDLQAESPSPPHFYYHSGYTAGMNFEAFDWLPNEAKQEDHYQLQTKISPWGTRRLRATDFVSEISAPDVHLVLDGITQSNYSKSSITIRNPDSVSVKNLQLVVEVRADTPSGASTWYLQNRLPNLKTAGEQETKMSLNSALLQSSISVGDILSSVNLRPATPPNTVRAFLIGSLDQSPGLKFDNGPSNFELYDDDAHIWLYEIPAEQIQIRNN